MSDDDDDLVRFAISVFFAKEQEGEVRLPVIRSGEPSNPCSVRCFTQDLSGQAGLRYGKVDTILEFDIGQTIAYVTIPILTDSAWHTCEEFAVKLSEPVRCTIRGSGCRVKIIDEDSFPSNDIADYLNPAANLELVPTRMFAKAFLSLCLAQPNIASKAWTSVAISLMHNAYFFMTTFLKLYLINTLLAVAEEEKEMDQSISDDGGFESASSRRLRSADAGLFGTELLVPDQLTATAMVVGAFYVVPFALLHLLDVVRAKLGISGTIRATLVSSVFRRYMSFQAAERARISGADIGMVCVRDIPTLVQDGLMRMFHLIEVLGKITVTMIFLLMQNRTAIIPFLAYPVFAFLWLWMRGEVMHQSQERQRRGGTAVARGVQRACDTQDLIMDYSKRSKAVDQFSEYVRENNQAISAGALVDLNNSRFFPWLTTISMAVYIVVGVNQLRSGVSSIGTFVTTFGIFNEVGHSMEHAYDCITTMTRAFHLVKNLTVVLNVPTDDYDRMKASRLRLKRGMAERDELHRTMQAGTGQYIDDLIDIQIVNLGYVLNTVQPTPKKEILSAVSFNIKQGTIAALKSGERQGKATLLRLLAGELPPSTGEVFIPPHLTVVQVNDTPKFVPGSLKRNLLFGLAGSDEAKTLGDVARVDDICKRLMLPQPLINRLHQDWSLEDGTTDRSSDGREEDETWMSTLTSTDRMTIHLARAFICNPHVLVLHKPLMRFYEMELREATMRAIQDFVKYRGLSLSNSPDDIQKRRKRTVVLSAFHTHEVDNADQVLEVANASVHEVDVAKKK
mmetsp:Transcript_6320/g.14455  ORF Transcript_6320/g.14455 Transcript_6320/m.14455 type:complete len:792 (-) Transcript_6320:226-2601(-)